MRPIAGIARGAVEYQTLTVDGVVGCFMVEVLQNHFLFPLMGLVGFPMANDVGVANCSFEKLGGVPQFSIIQPR